MPTLELSLEQIAALAEAPKSGPVVMLNLLKFARGGGSKSYAQYAEAFERLLTKHGGRFVYRGRAAELLVGEESWDAVALVEYPSRLAFAELIGSHEYAAIAPLRKGGLERTVLYATDPRT